MVAGVEETQPWRATEACGEENHVDHPTSNRSVEAQLANVQSEDV